MKQRCAADVVEAGLIRRVIRDEVWRHCGCVTLLEYLELVAGYGPRVARDRVRVALALQELPLLAQSLERGEHSYSAMRELTRVVAPSTQREWLEAASGKRLRQIEELVAARKPGDLPADPRDETVRKVLVTFEVTPAEAADLAEVTACWPTNSVNVSTMGRCSPSFVRRFERVARAIPSEPAIR